MTKLKCITWNLAHRLKKNPKQIKAIEERNPDIIAFQEVTLESSSIIKKILSSNYKSIVDSFELLSSQSVCVGPRRLGELIATKYDLKINLENKFSMPWKERVLAVNIKTPQDTIEFYNTYCRCIYRFKYFIQITFIYFIIKLKVFISNFFYF